MSGGSGVRSLASVCCAELAFFPGLFRTVPFSLEYLMPGLGSNLKLVTLMTKFLKIQWKLRGVLLLSFWAKPKYTFLREYRKLEGQI